MGSHIYIEIAESAEQKRKLCEKYAHEYFPKDKIELLIVGESPPIGETYFYIPEDLRRRHQGLPAKIFRVLFGATTRIDKVQCEQFLKEFQKRNFLLTDIVPFPIDCFISPIRAEIIEKEIHTFSDKMNSLQLSALCSKLLILPSGTYRALKANKYVNILNTLNSFGFKIIKWGDAEVQLNDIAQVLRERNVL